MANVKSKNMATVWATSPHLVTPLILLTGFNNAPIHRKNKATTIPGMTGRAGKNG